jgi:hypothetical protein
MSKGSERRWKLFIAIVIVLVLAASTLIGYYVENGLKSNPSLVYDFSAHAQYGSGSLLGWNATGNVSVNETNAVVISYLSSISRQFQSLSSTVDVSFNWSSQSSIQSETVETLNMIIHRQLNGNYSDLTYSSPAEGTAAYTYKTAFDVDKGTVFTVELTMNSPLGFLYEVELWNSAEVL